MLKRGEDEGVGVEGNDLRFQRMMMAQYGRFRVFRYRTLVTQSHTRDKRRRDIYVKCFQLFVFLLNWKFISFFFSSSSHLCLSELFLLIFCSMCAVHKLSSHRSFPMYRASLLFLFSSKFLPLFFQWPEEADKDEEK